MRRLLVPMTMMVALADTVTAHQYNEFKLGGWEGAAYVSDFNGIFTHCAISKRYPTGIFFSYGIGRNNEFDAFFGAESWHLAKHEKRIVSLDIDGANLGALPAYATGPHLLHIGLGRGRQLFEALRRGGKLTIRTAERNYVFDLTGVAQALQELQACRDRETGLP